MSIGTIIKDWAFEAEERSQELTKYEKEKYFEKLSICNACSLRTGSFCDKTRKEDHPNGTFVRGCGCLLTEKLTSLEATCPLNKFLPEHKY